MKILAAGATLNQTPIAWESNKQNIIYAIEYARLHGVQVLCLPELCITGYGCEDLFLSEWVYEKAMQVLLELKEYCYDIAVAIGLPVVFEGNRYNTACLIHNKEILGFYAKQFLANDGIHYETRWFNAWRWISVNKISLPNGQVVPFGNTVFEIEIEGKPIKIGFEICEDSWRKEQRPGYSYKQTGVHFILNPSASHFAFGKTKIRHDDLVVFGSKEFNCVYIFANLLGNEAGRAIYDGEVLIAQNGKLICRNSLFSFQDFNVQIASLDLDSVNNSEALIEPAPYLSKNEEFVSCLSLALFDYMRKSKSKGFVLSLSGGADSSTCAVLVAEMVKRALAELGVSYFAKKINIQLDQINSKDIVRKLLTCVYQGTINSSVQTEESARELASEIGAEFYTWKIDDEVKSYTAKVENALNRKLDWQTDDIALQNIQARTRSPIIWMLANIKNALLLATSNRSEGDVGYCTMDGDTSGSISPIAGIDKYFIKNWLLWAEASLGYESLKYVNRLDPSAELRPLGTVQRDEDDLMPYYILNEIEKLAIRGWKSPKETFAALNKEKLMSEAQLKIYIKKFYTLWGRNQWKRERLAPSFHLDDHNIDPRTWCRFPILNSGFEEELAKL
jgi:NAD+ synthase (glutamine-hydrolysing)